MVFRVHSPMMRDLVVSVLLALSSVAWSVPAPAQAQKLIVFAAASLKDALDEANAVYQRDKAQDTATSFAASPTLAKQIEAAAPADVFISADLDWMDYLAKRNLIKPETRANLLGNRLVLIAPVKSGGKLSSAPNYPLPQLRQRPPCHCRSNAVPAGRYGRPRWIAWRAAFRCRPLGAGGKCSGNNARSCRGGRRSGIVTRPTHPIRAHRRRLPENTRLPLIYRSPLGDVDQPRRRACRAFRYRLPPARSSRRRVHSLQ
jgi:hypothetical protein